MWWLAQTRQLQTVSQQSSLVRHQRLPLMAEREGTGRGIVGRQRRGRSAGQLKGPLNPNLYLMSERGEWGNRAGRGRPAPDSKGKERQHLHMQCRTGTARAPLLELGIWLHKADLSLQTWEYISARAEFRAVLISTERFHKQQQIV